MSRLRASQASVMASGESCVMVCQLGLEASEVGAEAVAYGGIAGFQLQAGDEIGIGAELDRDRTSENLDQGCPARLRLGGSQCAGSRNSDRRPIGTERGPRSVRQRGKPGREGIDEGGDPQFARHPVEKLTGNIDRQAAGAVSRGRRFGAAFVFDLRLSGGAKLVGLG